MIGDDERGAICGFTRLACWLASVMSTQAAAVAPDPLGPLGTYKYGQRYTRVLPAYDEQSSGPIRQQAMTFDGVQAQ